MKNFRFYFLILLMGCCFSTLAQSNIYPVKGDIRIRALANNRFLSIDDSLGGNKGAFEVTSAGDIHLKALSPYFSTNQLFLKHGGFVGLGTTNPQTLFHLKGEDPALTFETAHNAMLLKYISSQGSPQQRMSVLNGASVETLTILNDGNVGIGTTSPTEKLSVNGKIRSKEVKVEVSGWPDYVFKKGYHLQSLSETAQFIKLQGHLPGIPSAKEVEKDGIHLGEMNTKLLQKIEELTLYMIDQDKKSEILKEKNEQQDELIKGLSKQLTALRQQLEK